MRGCDGAFLAVIFFLGSVQAEAQSSSDIEQAARAGRRAGEEYRRQAAEADDAARQAQLASSMAEADIEDSVCKPMWKQTALTRREFIGSLTKKRSQQRKVIQVCYSNELHMYGFCSPMTEGYPQGGVAYPSSCVGRREDWPKPPQVSDFIPDRIADFPRAEAAYRALVAAKYR